MRILRGLVLILVLLLPAAAAWPDAELADSIYELVARFDDSACHRCHGEIHAQWQQSWHSRSLVTAVDIAATFLETGLKQQWQTEFSKDQLLKCLHCHAPTVQFAFEGLARHIADLMLVAAGATRAVPPERRLLELS